MRGILGLESFRAALPNVAPVLLIVLCSVVGITVLFLLIFSAVGFFWQGPWILELLEGLVPRMEKSADGTTPTRRLSVTACLILGAVFLLLLFGGSSLLVAFGGRVLRQPWFQAYHIFIWLAVVTAVLQAVLFRGNFSQLSWEKLGDLWLKPPGVALSVSGALVLADLFTGRQALQSSYTNLFWILLIAGVAGAALLLACLLKLVGRSMAADKTSQQPRSWFIPTFAFAFIATAGFFTVALNNAFVTLVVVVRSA